MSEDELSDGIADLQELIAEYKTEKIKEEPTESNLAKKRAPNKKKKKQRRSENEILNGFIEVPMDKVIFGDKEGLMKNMKKAVGVDTDDNAKTDADAQRQKRKPVWSDPDDEALKVGQVKLQKTRHTPVDHLPLGKNYKDYLKARFERIMPQPKWADLNRKQTVSNDMDSSDEELLQTVGFTSKKPLDTLPSHLVRIRRLKDLNRSNYDIGNVRCIEFHPSSTAALVAGRKGYAAIYAVDGRENAQLHSMLFKNFPIKCMKIMPCGTKAIFSANQKCYYHYDLLSAQETYRYLPKYVKSLCNFQISPCGKYMAAIGINGYLHLFDANANELLHSFKQDDNISNVCFTADSRRIITVSGGANVNIFSMQQLRLEHAFIDDGCIKGHAVDLSPNQRMLATGSLEGVVNVYDFQKAMQTTTPLPEKSFLNLKTAIADIKFNHSSELLAMCSAELKAGVKLAHFPSGTVYANFPGVNSELKKITTLSFSPNSGYLAMGGHCKGAPLYRLKHFKNY